MAAMTQRRAVGIGRPEVRALRSRARPFPTCASQLPRTADAVGLADSLSTDYSGDLDAWAFDEDNLLGWPQDDSTPSRARVHAPPNARPLVVLPGFGNNSADYEAPFGQPQGSLANNLRARGFSVHVVPIERKDWFNVARGVFTRGFWSCSLTTHPGYTWYLDRVAATVEAVRAETGSDQVDLIAHSAGGWLGRAFLGDAKYQQLGDGQATEPPAPPGTPSPTPHPAVRALVTLGTPQRPPPAELMRDMTGGAQGWVHNTYPGAHYADAGVRYVCCCGVAVRGQRETGPDGRAVRVRGRARTPSEYAHDSYRVVCGRGQDVEGDAVVPLSSAFLAGCARHVALPGVWHSVSKLGTFDTATEMPWYGSDNALDAWLHVYVEHAYSSLD